MNYESIILELMTRIKLLETRCERIEEQMANIVSLEGEEESSAVENIQRQKITKEQIRSCYECGAELFKYDHLDTALEIDKLVAKTSMNRNSAIMYVYAVKNMLSGKIYKRAINQTATELYFQYIMEDFGAETLKKAVNATRLHFEYLRQLGYTLNGLVELCDKYD